MSLDISIPAFPGSLSHRRAWAAWREALLDAAVLALPSNPFGLLGFLLSPADFRLLNDDADFIPCPAPVQPPPVLGFNPAPYQQWRHQSDQYTLERTRLAALKGSFLAALDESSRALVQDANGSTRNGTVQYFLTTLQEAYGTLTPIELQTNLASLAAPYVPPTAIREHIRLHTNVHQLAHRAGQPLNDFSKMQLLKDSVTPCGQFRDILTYYAFSHASIMEQTFLSLCTALIAGADNAAPTASSAGYAHAASSVAAAPDPAALQQATLDRLVDLMSQLVTERKSSDKRSGVKKQEYCWTHGPCGHRGADCQHPARGHQAAATASNRLSGK